MRLTLFALVLACVALLAAVDAAPPANRGRGRGRGRSPPPRPPPQTGKRSEIDQESEVEHLPGLSEDPTDGGRPWDQPRDILEATESGNNAPNNRRSARGNPTRQGNGRGKAKGHMMTDDEGDVYMTRFGYNRRNKNRDANQRRRSIMRFQKMAGVPMTGKIDEATSEMMQMPRCGNEDPDFDSSSRKRRFVAATSWGKTDLTYSFKNFNLDLGESETKRIIRKSFDMWEAVTPLKFTLISQVGDIEIIFGAGRHTSYAWDQSVFDGSGGTLAHAFFPYGDNQAPSGDAHFDEDEFFTDGTYSGINLLQVAVHEFGHSLGLEHSDVEAAIMAPFYRQYNPNFALDSDDIAGIQSLYGGKPVTEKPTTPSRPLTEKPTTSTSTSTTASTTPSRPVTERPTTTTSTSTTSPTTPSTTTTTTTQATTTRRTTTTAPSGDHHCDDGRVDAIADFRRGDYKSIVFRGNEYMVLDYNGVTEGYPRSLSEIAPAFDAVDAALALPGNRLFLFKKNKVYLVYLDNNYRKYAIYGPYNTNQIIPGLPNNIDAIFTWSGNGRIYIFKGNQYYRLSNQGRIDRGYPRPISAWRLPSTLGSGVDAIVQYNHRTFFFKGGQYYRYNDNNGQVDSGYPRDTASAWFGC